MKDKLMTAGMSTIGMTTYTFVCVNFFIYLDKTFMNNIKDNKYKLTSIELKELYSNNFWFIGF